LKGVARCRAFDSHRQRLGSRHERRVWNEHGKFAAFLPVNSEKMLAGQYRSFLPALTFLMISSNCRIEMKKLSLQLCYPDFQNECCRPGDVIVYDRQLQDEMQLLAETVHLGTHMNRQSQLAGQGHDIIQIGDLLLPQLGIGDVPVAIRYDVEYDDTIGNEQLQ